jgi:hypothetical protein
MISTFAAAALRCRTSLPVTARTGTHCPLSGRWNPAGDRQNSQLFFEGSVMPPFDGAPVAWVLDPDAERH